MAFSNIDYSEVLTRDKTMSYEGYHKILTQSDGRIESYAR
jgi:hypothetical protein